MMKVVYFLLATLVLIADRLSKYAALIWCQERYVINNYISFDVAFNRGISWGFFHSHSNYFFILVSLVIAAITVAVAYQALPRYQQGALIVGEVLVIAGSVSNLFDRAYYHGVIDFIELSYGLYVWPIFNIADMCIVAGVGIMFMEYYRHE